MSHHDTLPTSSPTETNDWGDDGWDTPPVSTPELGVESPKRKGLMKRLADKVLKKTSGELPVEAAEVPSLSAFKLEAMEAERAAEGSLRLAEEKSRVQSADMWERLDAAAGEYYGGPDKDTKFSFAPEAPKMVDQRTRPTPERQKVLAEIMMSPEKIWRDSRERNPGEPNEMLDAIDAYREARAYNLDLPNDATAPGIPKEDDW